MSTARPVPGLPRDELLALVAAAHRRTPIEKATKADPYLQKRLDDAATIARWEERIRRAAITAFGKWTALCRTAVLDGTSVVLAAGHGTDEPHTSVDLPPDPGAIAGLGPAWDSIAQATIVTSVGDLLGETFGQYLLDGDGVVSARAWSTEHLATVSNRLSGVADHTWQRVSATLQEGHDAGESIPKLRDRVLNMLSPRVGGGSNYWRTRATVIARTETTSAMNGGHQAARTAMQRAKASAGLGGGTGGGELEEGTKVWVATMDERTRPSHVLADGQSVPLSKPFELMGGQLQYPGDPDGPAGETVNCLVPGSAVSWAGQAVLGTTRRRYAGPLVQLSTGRGHVLTVTPNHPVLTPAGYVPAGQLRPGQQVIAAGVPGRPQPQVADRPARVEQLHASLREAGRQQRVMGRGVDFHGDGVEGEDVEVVRADRDLLAHGETQGAGAVDQRGLVGLGDRAAAVPGVGGAVVALGDHDGARPGGPAAAGGVRGLGERPALGGVQAGQAQPVGLAARSDGQAQLLEAADDGGAADAEVARHLLHAHALGMGADELVEVQVLAGYHGDVYNLSTTEQWYSANGIACHNCRCTVMYLDAGASLADYAGIDRQLGQDTVEGYDGVGTAADYAAEEEDAAAAADAELAAETDAETGDVLAEADADAEAAADAAEGAAAVEGETGGADAEPSGGEPAPEGEPAEPATEPGEATAEAPEAAEAAEAPEAPEVPAAEAAPELADPAAGAPRLPAVADEGAQLAADNAQTLADLPAGAVDEAGVPWRLTYDFLSSQTPEELDSLSDYLAEGLGSDDPLEGARWDDFERFLDYSEREEALVNDLASIHASDMEITRAVEEFQQTEGTPGLTHPDVGGRADVKAGVPTRAEVQDEYSVFLHEQYLRASDFTRGHFLSPAGRAKDVDPATFFGGGFKGGIRDLVRYASEELLEFFENDRRVSWAEFYYDRTRSEAFAEKAAKAKRANAGIGRDRINPLTAAPGPVPEPTEAQVAAYRAGRAAWTAGAPVTARPAYGPDDVAALGRLWVRGWVYARRDALGAAAVAAGLLTPSWELTGPRSAPPGGSVTAAPASTPENDDAAGSGPGAQPDPEGPSVPRTWRSDPYIAPFATPTGDGRIFAVGSLTSRELPLPLLFQDNSAPGHDQSTVVGRITDVQFTPEGIVASGDYLDDPAVADVVAKAIARTEAGLGHVSVDLAACTGELVDADGNAVDMAAVFEAWDAGQDPVVLEQITAGELIACTQVATPAFGVGAKIAMSDTAEALDPAAETPVGGEFADGEQSFVMVDKAGDPIAIGDVVEVAVGDTGDEQPDPASAEAAGNPVADAAGNPPPKAPGQDPEATDNPKTVKGTITFLDPAASKVTVQPEDETAEPLVVTPDQIVKVDAPAKKTGESGVPTPSAALEGGQAFAPVPPTSGPSADPAKAPKDTAPAPAEDPAPAPAAPKGPEEVEAVKAQGDLDLLAAVAPHYDAAAKLVTEVFGSLSDERVKALAADLVEDAAEWRALADYGLTPDDDDMEIGEDEALTAAAGPAAQAGPLAPPAEWFDNPGLTAPTALTITPEGRVYGHAATWGTCHVGFSKTCVTPPPSSSSYAYFHTGEVTCADGSRVAVGNLTLGGRHASVELGYRSAIEHYDVQGAGVAVVRMYEDEHGIAFAGALTPSVTEGQLYDLKRSPVSGDWRRVGGNLELIGVLSVNAPGFPTPRFRTDQGGRTALTAAPGVAPARKLRTRTPGVSDARLSQLIQAQIGKEVAAELGRQRAAEQRAKRLQLATRVVKGDPRDRLAALAASVDGGRSQARRDRMASLAERVA